MGYAPRDRKRLIRKKMTIYPIKKSMEIEDWILSVSFCYGVVYLSILALLLIDIYSRVDGLSNSEMDSCGYTIMILFCYIIIVIVITITSCYYLPQRHFKIGYYLGILQYFLLVFWIIQFNSHFIFGTKVDKMRRQFIFTIFSQVVAIPLLFGTTYISSQVFLKVSMLRPKYYEYDLYEVIYGGEGSSTKKINIS